MNGCDDGERDQQQPWRVYILDALKPVNVFLWGVKKQGIGVVKPGAHGERGDGNGRAKMSEGPSMIECRRRRRKRRHLFGSNSDSNNRTIEH